MRQARHVDHHRVAGDVLAEEDRDLHRAALGLRLLDHLAEADHLAVGIWHLDPHGVLARDRRHDPHARHAEGDGEVVGEVCDLGQAETGLEFDLVLRDDRAGFDLDHADLEAEVGERLLEHAGPFADLLLLGVELQLLGRQQQFERWQFVVGRRIGGHLQDFGLAAAVDERSDRHRRTNLLDDLGVFARLGGVIGILGGLVGGLELVGLDRRLLATPHADRGLDTVVSSSAVGSGFFTESRGQPRPQARETSQRIGDLHVGVGTRGSRPRGQPPTESTARPANDRQEAPGPCGCPQQDGIAGEKEAGAGDRGHDDGGAGSGKIGFGEEPTRGAGGAAGAPERPGDPGWRKHCQQRADAHRGEHGTDGPQREIGKRAALQQHDIETGEKPDHEPRAEPEALEEPRRHRRTEQTAGIRRPGMRWKLPRGWRIGWIECCQ